MAGTSKISAAHVRPVDQDYDTAKDAPKARSDEAPAAVAPIAAPAPDAPEKQPKRRRFVVPIIGLAVLGAAGWFGYEYWTNGRFMISTDDAYIEGDLTSIAPKVSGYVETVNVVANQRVKAGDPLVTLDNGDYRIAADQAQAQIDTEKLSLARFDAQIAGAQASLMQARAQKTALEATVRGAEITQKRASDLQSKAVGSVASLDSANVALDQARANVLAADATIAAAAANVSVLQAQRAEAESTIRSLELSRDKAQRDLGFTVLKAPYDGVVGNLAVQDGDLVSAGQRLAALVPVNKLYIDANFKETQIAGLVPGSKVKVHVDAYDDKPIEATVQSIAPASGSVFSLLPPENATGNFTKVIQRVPVRIALPQDVLDSGRLQAGLSVVVEVDTRTAPQTTDTGSPR
ncbi:HlyD family secretion protein [Rhizobium sp. Leaf341]|uniref:HlyD family secretion protein n=1 Tax=Rhizobium sp. Leaf341 TaxID=1736344 RepID=UPI000712A761|nr:HlyD family secretion protein [Rhizobium sp. Leaf341]KQR75971.1 hemolysin D [Rhizobium sp. Leaf341]